MAFQSNRPIQRPRSTEPLVAHKRSPPPSLSLSELSLPPSVCMTHTAPQTPTVPHSTLTNGRTRTAAAGATVFPPVFLTSHAPVTARSPVGLRLSEFFPSCSHPSPLTPTDSDHGWPITHSFLSIVSHSLLCLSLARSLRISTSRSSSTAYCASRFRGRVFLIFARQSCSRSFNHVRTFYL